jgi:hypothetical protein
MVDSNEVLFSAASVAVATSLASSILDLKTTPASPRRGFSWQLTLNQIINAGTAAGAVTVTMQEGSETAFTANPQTAILRQFVYPVPTAAAAATIYPPPFTFVTHNAQRYMKASIQTSASVSCPNVFGQMATGSYQS